MLNTLMQDAFFCNLVFLKRFVLVSVYSNKWARRPKWLTGSATKIRILNRRSARSTTATKKGSIETELAPGTPTKGHDRTEPDPTLPYRECEPDICFYRSRAVSDSDWSFSWKQYLTFTRQFKLFSSWLAGHVVRSPLVSPAPRLDHSYYQIGRKIQDGPIHHNRGENHAKSPSF